MSRPQLLLCLVCLTLAIPSLGQSVPAGMVMHRIQAGEPEADGWISASSTEGGFSVRMPLKFNDFTVVESKPNDPVLRAFTVGAKSQEGIKFVATRIVYRKGAASAAQFFANFETGKSLGDPPGSVTPLAVHGRRAVDFVLRSKSAVSYQRAVLLKTDLLLLTVESPLGFEATAHELAPAFLDSLTIRTP